MTKQEAADIQGRGNHAPDTRSPPRTGIIATPSTIATSSLINATSTTPKPP